MDAHGYSLAVIEKAVRASGEARSFKRGAGLMQSLAEVPIGATQMARLTHEIGGELVAQRDAQSAAHRLRQLPIESEHPVEIACVEVDGGRAHTRTPGQGRGVYNPQWKEPKYGVLWRMAGAVHPEDPHPKLPRCFLDRERLTKLVRQLHGTVLPADDTPEFAMTEQPESAPLDSHATQAAPRQWPPRRVFRTCVATTRNVYGFGPLMAAEAQRRGFYQAPRQVFLGDGQEANWTVHRLHFSHFTAVTDFMHAAPYIYRAVEILASGETFWQSCLEKLTACWQGRVKDVIDWIKAEERCRAVPEGEVVTKLPDTDPRKILAESRGYLENNQERMNYPEYRRQGLPVTSSLIESLIKEFNWRIKGTEKFWNLPGEAPTSSRTSQPVRRRTANDPEPEVFDMHLEHMLAVSAALLSDGDPLHHHFESRPGSPFVRKAPPTQTPTSVI